MIKISSGTSVRLLGQLGMDLTGLTVNFLFEQADPVSSDSSGYVLTLSGSQAQTRAAVVVGNPTQGQAAYTLVAADTMNPGQYRAQFQVAQPGPGTSGPTSAATLYFPAQGWIWFDIAAFAAPTTISSLWDFCEPVRAIMGDFRKPFRFEDAALESVVRSMVRMGKLGSRYGVTADGRSVSPAVTRAQDLALLVYWSARTLLRHAGPPTYRGEMSGTATPASAHRSGRRSTSSRRRRMAGCRPSHVRTKSSTSKT